MGYKCWTRAIQSGLSRFKNSEIIEVICDGTAAGKRDNYNLATGEYRIKLVGDNSKLAGQFYIEQK